MLDIWGFRRFVLGIRRITDTSLNQVTNLVEL